MQPIYGAEADNQIGRSDEEGNMPVIPSGKNAIIKEWYISSINCILMTIGDYNDPAPENLPVHQQQKQGW